MRPSSVGDINTNLHEVAFGTHGMAAYPAVTRMLNTEVGRISLVVSPFGAAL